MNIRMLIAPAVAAMVALGGCSGAPHAATAVSTAPAASEGVVHGLRRVHSPGIVTDDMHLLAGRCQQHQAADGDPLPDPACTPGAVDPAVTQATIGMTICVKGWTATVRPPVSDTARWKRMSEADYGDPAAWSGEYDHLVPLELGGANSTSNLWPEVGVIPNAKDKVENNLRSAVCAGHLSLRKAQTEIAADWTVAQW